MVHQKDLDLIFQWTEKGRWIGDAPDEESDWDFVPASDVTDPDFIQGGNLRIAKYDK